MYKAPENAPEGWNAGHVDYISIWHAEWLQA